MMVLINFQLMLATGPTAADSTASRLLRWCVHVPSGRSSSLFVVLAGAGITLLTRAARRSGDRIAWRVAVRTLLLRSLFLVCAGIALWHVWAIDILHFYACYLLLATLFLIWLPDRLLLLAYAALVFSGAAFDLVLPELPELPFRTPLGFLLDVFFEGVHPIFPWLAFITYGLWLGRQRLADPHVRWRLALYAGFVVVSVELGSLALSLAVIAAPPLAPLRPWVGLLATGWTPDPLYVISASGTATLVITLAHELVAHERIRTHVVTRALIATGQLALSIYVTHAVVGVVIPRALFHWSHSLSVEAVTAHWAAFCLTVIVLSAIYRRYLSRGPLEFVMRSLTSWRLPRERIDLALPPASTAPSRPLAHVRPALALLSLLAVTLAAIRILGLPMPVSTSHAPEDRFGQLTLASQREEHALHLDRAARVMLETHSGVDLYLELDAVDASGARTRIGEDDDSGEGTDARLTQALTPGDYVISVRPYGATTGPYALTIRAVE